MKIKLISAICAVVCVNFANAQFDSTKAIRLRDKLVDSVCVCITKTDTSSVNTLQDANQMLTRCITDNMDAMMEYVSAAGIDFSNSSQEKIQEAATYIASVVYRKCPTMRIMINRVKSKGAN